MRHVLGHIGSILGLGPAILVFKGGFKVSSRTLGGIEAVMVLTLISLK